jgi:hypothetical protein
MAATPSSCSNCKRNYCKHSTATGEVTTVESIARGGFYWRPRRSTCTQLFEAQERASNAFFETGTGHGRDGGETDCRAPEQGVRGVPRRADPIAPPPKEERDAVESIARRLPFFAPSLLALRIRGEQSHPDQTPDGVGTGWMAGLPAAPFINVSTDHVLEDAISGIVPNVNLGARLHGALFPRP